MNKRTIVALICTLSCLFSIIGARTDLDSAATMEQCVIHNLPENTPVLLNTSDGTIGELALSSWTQMEQGPLDNDGIALASYFTYECKYPGFTVTANSSSRDVSIEIPKEHIAGYDHRLAAQYICEDCLRLLEGTDTQSNFLFLVLKEDMLCVHCLNEEEHAFFLPDLAFSVFKNDPTELLIQMEAKSRVK